MSTQWIQISENEVNKIEDKGDSKVITSYFYTLIDDTYVWAKLNGEVENLEIRPVQWMSQSELDSIKAQKQLEDEINSFKESRYKALMESTVTTSLGNIYDADEVSISRMLGRIYRERNSEDYKIIPWSLFTDDTGIMSDVTLGDLKEAYDLAVDNMAALWSR